jgi:hypothetical protein
MSGCDTPKLLDFVSDRFLALDRGELWPFTFGLKSELARPLGARSPIVPLRVAERVAPVTCPTFVHRRKTMYGNEKGGAIHSLFHVQGG